MVPAYAGENTLYGLELSVPYSLEKEQSNLINHSTYVAEPVFSQPDRHGNNTSIVWLSSNKQTSLQSILLEKGLARLAVYDQSISVDLHQNWQEAETNARQQKRGIWAFSHFDIAAPQTVQPYRFQIIEGIITDIHESQKTIFLNFGEDWKEDFTILIKPNLWKDSAWVRPEIGQTIQIRGWVETYYGPMIKMHSPYQLKILSPSTK